MKTLSLLTILLAGSFVATSLAQSTPEKTIANLKAAVKGKSNASHRYEEFSQKADAEGYKQVAKLFRAASKAEFIHHEAHKQAILKLGGKVEPFGLDKITLGTTKENLEAAIKGETYEGSVMYPEFLKQAQADKAVPAIRIFRFALAVETEHARLYQDALINLGNNPAVDLYVCPVCGQMFAGVQDRSCPVCGAGKERLIKF